MAAIGFIAFGLFPPFTLAFITVGTTFAMGAVLSAIDIYMNEKEHVKKTVRYQEDVTKISKKHNQELRVAKHELQNVFQKMIDRYAFLEPDQHVPDDSQLHDISIEKVPTSLAKSHFSMWNNGNSERSSLPEMSHLNKSSASVKR